MGEPWRPDDVARRVDTLHARLIIVADFHVIAVELDRHGFTEHTLEIRNDANGGEHRLSLDRGALTIFDEVELHGILPDLETFALRRGVNRDALFLE